MGRRGGYSYETLPHPRLLVSEASRGRARATLAPIGNHGPPTGTWLSCHTTRTRGANCLCCVKLQCNFPIRLADVGVEAWLQEPPAIGYIICHLLELASAGVPVGRACRYRARIIGKELSLTEEMQELRTCTYVTVRPSYLPDLALRHSAIPPHLAILGFSGRSTSLHIMVSWHNCSSLKVKIEFLGPDSSLSALDAPVWSS